MGYYKVPQDVEAEDKLIGPFSFKQFIFVLLTLMFGYFTFRAAAANLFAGAIFLPFTLVFAIFGFWHPKDQPVENKLFAYMSYFLKPRTRLWSRDGIVQHVIIKAPKKVETNFSDQRTPEQVRNQLKRLAKVVDTRGWSTKQASIQLPAGHDYSNDDRIYNPALTAPKIESEIHEDEDIFDERTNPVAQNIDRLTKQAAEEIRSTAVENMSKVVQPNPKQAVDPRFVGPKPTIHHDTHGKEDKKHTESSHKDRDQKSQVKRSAPSASNGSPAYRPYPSMKQQTINPYGNNDTDQPPDDEPDEEEIAEKIKELGKTDLPVSTIEHRAKEIQSEQEGSFKIEH